MAYRNFPLSIHNNAQNAAEAAECARVQGKFWEYHDKLFANQTNLGKDKLKEYAKDVGLDAEKFGSCLETGASKPAVAKSVAGGNGYGVSGTPAFFINGRFVNGAAALESFTTIIDEELARGK